MINSITVLAQLPGGAESSPGVGGVVVVGFLFVIVVLAVLALVTTGMGAWFTKQAAKSAEKAAEAASESTAGSASASSFAADSSELGLAEDDPALVAVIAAAVHTMVGDRPHRVVSIRSAGPGWAQEGRRQIFSSHRVR